MPTGARGALQPVERWAARLQCAEWGLESGLRGVGRARGVFLVGQWERAGARLCRDKQDRLQSCTGGAELCF